MNPLSFSANVLTVLLFVYLLYLIGGMANDLQRIRTLLEQKTDEA